MSTICVAQITHFIEPPLLGENIQHTAQRAVEALEMKGGVTFFHHNHRLCIVIDGASVEDVLHTVNTRNSTSRVKIFEVPYLELIQLQDIKEDPLYVDKVIANAVTTAGYKWETQAFLYLGSLVVVLPGATEKEVHDYLPDF